MQWRLRSVARRAQEGDQLGAARSEELCMLRVEGSRLCLDAQPIAVRRDYNASVAKERDELAWRCMV
jgi:hypothetical protein